MDINILLSKIAAINKKYEAIYKETGEKFNVFNILKLTRDELSHSNMIASLLDPNGDHGKGNLFLKLFIEIINNKINNLNNKNIKIINITNFCNDTTIVKREHYMGPIPENYESGGFIDIYITDFSKNNILLENKIDDKGQKKQLWRYYNYKKENAHIIYLTLYGEEASKFSTDNIDNIKFDYIRISYEKDIIEWLNKCKREVLNNPIIRETLTQYIILIKQLTGQTRSDKMKEEYLEAIFSNSENINAVFDIYDGINEVQFKIITDYLPVLNEIAKDCGLVLKTPSIEEIKETNTIVFMKPEWKYLEITFYLNLKNSIDYGINANGKNLEDLHEYLIKKNIDKEFNPRKKGDLFWKSMELSVKSDFYKELYKKNKFIIKEKIDELLIFLEGYTGEL